MKNVYKLRKIVETNVWKLDFGQQINKSVFSQKISSKRHRSLIFFLVTYKRCAKECSLSWYESDSETSLRTPKIESKRLKSRFGWKNLKIIFFFKKIRALKRVLQVGWTYFSKISLWNTKSLRKKTSLYLV